MRALQRRRLLGAIGALAAAGTGAGCIDESTIGDGNGDGTGNGNGDDRLRGDGVVDYPGMVDGAAAVRADERTIEYEDPEATFQLEAGYEGDTADESEIRVGRDLTVETMAAFVAPVAVDGGFEYHVFANEAFVEFADWNVVALVPGGEPEDRGSPGFEPIGDGVYGTVVEPGDAAFIMIVDGTAEAVAEGGDQGLSGIAITRGPRDGVQPTAPNVQLGFDYDAEAERLEVTHEGGDGVARDELRFVSDADVSVLTGFEDDPVRAGNRATLSVPPSATVRVVWESSDDDHSATLASWSGPDA